jgi:hypothetical protein
MLTNGTDYQILWHEFVPGTSMFIPAVDIKAATAAIKRESERLEFEYIQKVVIEKGIKGIRVWRL